METITLVTSPETKVNICPLPSDLPTPVCKLPEITLQTSKHGSTKPEGSTLEITKLESSKLEGTKPDSTNFQMTELKEKLGSSRPDSPRPDSTPFGSFDSAELDSEGFESARYWSTQTDMPEDLWKMAEPALDKELDQLNKTVNLVVGKKPFCRRPFKFADEPEKKALKKQNEFLCSYELKNSITIRYALSKGMLNPNFFHEALSKMPAHKVTMFVLLTKIRRFELAYTMAEIILRGSESALESEDWAFLLSNLIDEPSLKQENSRTEYFAQEEMFLRLQDMLSEVAEGGEVPGIKRSSETIDEAFQGNDWEGLKKLYNEQKDLPLTKGQLNKVVLMAAWKGKWMIFMECVERGADLIGRVKEMDTDSETAWFSPLHEFVKVGGIKLEQLEGVFPEDLVNFTDAEGNTLLHLAVFDWNREVRMDNIHFLIKHKADVNIANASGMTVIDTLVSQGDAHCDVDALVAVVEGANHVDSHSRREASGWSALHVLCARGSYKHVTSFVEKGANKFDLRRKLTLIDTVVLQESLHFSQKKETLAVLLNSPISLGPFHAEVVKQRPLQADNMAYKEHIIMGKNYIYPLERLFFPVVSTRWLRKANLELVEMLVDAGAVCDAEIQFMEPYLTALKDEGMGEVVQYLLPKIRKLDSTPKVSTTNGSSTLQEMEERTE